MLQMAEETLSRMLKALADGLQVGIFDATNTTVKRRDWLRRRVVDECGHRLLFAEIICTDDGMIRRNVRQTKLKSPDYTCVAVCAVVVRCRWCNLARRRRAMLRRDRSRLPTPFALRLLLWS